MFDREAFLRSVRRETEICKHLQGKLPAGALDFSLGKSMRNTLELLRYLTCCAHLPAYCLINDAWSEAQDKLRASETLLSTDFPGAMDTQLHSIESLLAGLEKEDLATRVVALPWGGEMPLGEALVNTSLKFITAYRMQLFLHAKAAGASALDTANCWLGADRQPA